MLTETTIRKAKTPAKPTKLSDERGLYLLCAPSSGKWWRFKYRYDGKEKLLSLGTYLEVSPAKARVDREEARRQLAAGIDPSVSRRQEKRQKVEATANNFEGIAREWLEIVRPGWADRGRADESKTPHHVPLSVQAVEAFRELQRMNGKRPWIFAGRAPSKPMSKNTVLFAIYRLGYHSRMTGHGFRALPSTILNEMGYRPDVIEMQLAHTEKNAVRAAYHRSQYLQERRTMMQAWADRLDAQRDKEAKIVAFRLGRHESAS